MAPRSTPYSRVRVGEIYIRVIYPQIGRRSTTSRSFIHPRRVSNFQLTISALTPTSSFEFSGSGRTIEAWPIVGPPFQKAHQHYDNAATTARHLFMAESVSGRSAYGERIRCTHCVALLVIILMAVHSCDTVEAGQTADPSALSYGGSSYITSSPAPSTFK